MKGQPPYQRGPEYVPSSIQALNECIEEGRSVNLPAKEMVKYKSLAVQKQHSSTQDENLEGIREELGNITEAIKSATIWLVGKG